MDSVLEMLAYELAAVFAVLSLWLILRNIKKDKTTHEMASQTVKKLKRAKELRVEKLSAILAEKYALSGDALSREAIAFQDREQQIYKSLLTVFVEQDDEALLSIPDQLEKAIDASLNLLPMEAEPTQAQIDDSTLTLNEQIAATSLQLEELMVLFRQTNGQDPVKLPQSETEEADRESDEQSHFMSRCNKRKTPFNNIKQKQNKPKLMPLK